MFGTVLIANRGEIALRIARTCKEMGIRTVVVYSSDDERSAAVSYADAAVRIGPPAPRRSYLNASAILEAAAQTGADAVHPGYGFLSEDPDFADACEKEGFAFIGPPAGVLERLGDKVRARELMLSAGLPLLPGSPRPVDDLDAAGEVALRIGYPLIIKAAAGGGGRGMRVVRRANELRTAYAATRADARAFFTDGRVYIEKYVEAGRHVEVQVLCDAYGAGVHLGERDCTTQRRQQKLIEETPAPRLSAALLDEMRQAAVRGALAAGYVGAGTFEFLVDDAGRFTFMEVNGRIQVEHPVTEMAVGIDLVGEQLRLAAGEPLGLRQEDVRSRGAVIECRVNAEDPGRDFAPTPGRLTAFDPPAGPFVRVDTHAGPGAWISPSYDSLLAKVIVWAPDRDRAIDRMRRALADFRVSGDGVRTTIPFLLELLDGRAFRAAEHRLGDLARPR